MADSSTSVSRQLYTQSEIESRIKKAQRQVNLDNAEMEEIICQYIQDTPVMVENLASAWMRSDFESIILYAHSLVGVTRLLYFHDVGEYAKTIEDLAKLNLRSGETTLHQLQKYHEASLGVLREMYPCLASGQPS